MTNLEFTNLQFTRDAIAFDAVNIVTVLNEAAKSLKMDAVEFQQFLEDMDISHEWNEVTVGDFNNGIYDVYLLDFDMPVRFINGVFIPEED